VQTAEKVALLQQTLRSFWGCGSASAGPAPSPLLPTPDERASHQAPSPMAGYGGAAGYGGGYGGPAGAVGVGGTPGGGGVYRSLENLDALKGELDVMKRDFAMMSPQQPR
jgi:hypothetical protein